MAGKGDVYRSVDRSTFGDNFDKIFGVRPKHVCREWVRGPKGEIQCYHCAELPPPQELPASFWEDEKK